MNTESEPAVDESEPVVDESQDSSSESVDSSSDQDAGDVHAPDFQPLTDSGTGGPVGDLSRLQNIQIMVTAELGRVEIPIQQLMSLTKGSVLQLDQSIDSLVDLVAQGVTLASGEVVVVDGRFAIRIL